MKINSTTVQMTPREFTELWLDIAKVRGIGTMHEVRMDENNPGTYYYLACATDGEYNSLKKWARTKTDVIVWSTPVSENGYDAVWHYRSGFAMRTAVQHAADAAVAEVVREFS